MIPMSTAEIWLAIIGLTVVVVLTRNVFLLAPRRWQPRGAIEQALRYAPLAALVALTVPEVIGGALQADDALGALADGRLPAALVLLAVARATRNPFAGLAVGAAVYLAIVNLPLGAA